MKRKLITTLFFVFASCLMLVGCGDHVHKYKEEVLREPTCVLEGVILHSCESGDDRYTETTPSLGHTYETKTYSPNCTQGGYTESICSVCHDRTIKEQVPPTGHKYTSKVEKESTCTESGKVVYQCSSCQEGYEEILAPLGHDFTEWELITEATCTQEGKMVRSCKRDASHTEEMILPMKEHSFSEELLKEPTCTETGISVMTCKDCSLQLSQTKPMLAHEFEETGVGVAPSCTVAGNQEVACKHCGVSYVVEIPALGHDFGPWEVLTKPTCLNKGEEICYCVRNRAHAQMRIAMPTGHDFVDVKGLKPTCEEEGYSAYIECKNCELEDGKRVLPALGHDWGDWTVDEEATCSKEGIEIRTCKADKTHTESREIPIQNHYFIGNECKYCGEQGTMGIELEEDAIVGYKGADTSVILPTKNLGKAVTKVGGFKGTSVKELTIHSGITTISANAFNGCISLKRLVVSEGSKLSSVGTGAFKDVVLDVLVVDKTIKKDTLTTLSASAKKIEFNGTISEWLKGGFALSTTATVEEVVWTDSESIINEYGVLTIPTSITTIGDYSLAGLDFVAVKVPEGVEKIGKGVFTGEIPTAYLPKSLKTLSVDALAGVSTVHFSGTTEEWEAVEKTNAYSSELIVFCND